MSTCWEMRNSSDTKTYFTPSHSNNTWSKRPENKFPTTILHTIHFQDKNERLSKYETKNSGKNKFKTDFNQLRIGLIYLFWCPSCSNCHVKSDNYHVRISERAPTGKVKFTSCSIYTSKECYSWRWWEKNHPL